MPVGCLLLNIVQREITSKRDECCSRYTRKLLNSDISGLRDIN